jgi:hypothetical protein
MNNIFYVRGFYLLFLTFAPLFLSIAQQKEYIAIIPTFHDRLNTSGNESSLQLQNQRFILFVYRNAVAVYSEADFVNTGMDTLSQEFALPSTGHDENGAEQDGRISSGILSTQLWVEGERIDPELVNGSNEDWYTIQSHFSPGEQHKVKALFWAQTSLTDVDSLPGLDTVDIPIGKRGFIIDLAHATVWNNVIQSIDVSIVLKVGLSFQKNSFDVEPATYDIQDSTITWALKYIEPSTDDNITVSYTPSGTWKSSTNTMAKLSGYIVKKVYDNLLYYVEQTNQE